MGDREPIYRKIERLTTERNDARDALTRLRDALQPEVLHVVRKHGDDDTVERLEVALGITRRPDSFDDIELREVCKHLACAGPEHNHVGGTIHGERIEHG